MGAADVIAARVRLELPGGLVVGRGDVTVCRHLHRYLMDRFASHLNLLRARPLKRE